MFEIVIPKLNNNDTEYVLVEWLAEDGDQVEADTPVAVVETSKVAHDLVAPVRGTLRRLLPVAGDCAPGDVAGQLFGSAAELTAYVTGGDGASLGGPEPGDPPAVRQSVDDPLARDPLAGGRPAGDPPPGDSPAGDTAPGGPGRDGVVITEAARERARQVGVPEARLRELGLRVVRASDIDGLRASDIDGPAATGRTVDLSPNQRAVARTVGSSEVSPAAAGVVLKIRADPAYDLRRRWLAATGEAGLAIPALLVKAVAESFERFPLFFGRLLPGGRSLALPSAADVGVTIDVGTGLFVPVLRGPAARPLADTVAGLDGFRRKARAGSFEPQDLSGGAITVTLHDYTDVVCAMPVVFPGQVAALALGGTATEPFVRPDGRVAVRRVFHLGLAYDHRVVNGRDAVMFLKDVKAALESPDRLLSAAEITKVNPPQGAERC